MKPQDFTALEIHVKITHMFCDRNLQISHKISPFLGQRSVLHTSVSHVYKHEWQSTCKSNFKTDHARYTTLLFFIYLLSCTPWWTPPIPPVTNIWIPAMFATTIVPLTVVPPFNFCKEATDKEEIVLGTSSYCYTQESSLTNTVSHVKSSNDKSKSHTLYIPNWWPLESPSVKFWWLSWQGLLNAPSLCWTTLKKNITHIAHNYDQQVNCKIPFFVYILFALINRKWISNHFQSVLFHLAT